MTDTVLMQTDNVRKNFSEDMSILRALSIVFERKPELRSVLASNSNYVTTVIHSLTAQAVYNVIFTIGCRLEGLPHKVLQWYLCRMEGWFAADADAISLKCWDQVIKRNLVQDVWGSIICIIHFKFLLLKFELHDKSFIGSGLKNNAWETFFVFPFQLLSLSM